MWLLFLYICAVKYVDLISLFNCYVLLSLLFLWCGFLVSRVKILFGVMQKALLRMKGFCDQIQMEHTDLEYL
jgi:hypothetical protein